MPQLGQRDGSVRTLFSFGKDTPLDVEAETRDIHNTLLTPLNNRLLGPLGLNSQTLSTMPCALPWARTLFSVVPHYFCFNIQLSDGVGYCVRLLGGLGLPICLSLSRADISWFALLCAQRSTPNSLRPCRWYLSWATTPGKNMTRWC